MKRFWLVLLSLGLVMAFSASAFAVDVKFSGSYFAAGAYLDKTNLVRDNPAATGSTAFYFQRLQLTTEFVAAPGVSLVTRANIMERVWGGPRSTPNAVLDAAGGSAATRAENENIGFDYGYIKYASPIGIFQVGYMSDSTWGTTWYNSETARGKIAYTLPIGNWNIIAQIAKYTENNYTASNATAAAAAQQDHDFDKYSAGFRYTGKSFEGGFLASYYNDSSHRIPAQALADTGYTGRYWVFQPYAKAKIGPVDIQAEVNYGVGDYIRRDDGTAAVLANPNNVDQKLNSLGGWIDAVATFGPVYVGGTFAYAQGPDDSIDKKSDFINGGRDWSPTLIMFNYDRQYWVGNVVGNGYTAVNGTPAFGQAMTNAWFYQIRGGVKPTDKLDIGAAVAFAQADNLKGATQAGFNSRDLGWEIDVTGTYKITNNLSYLLGFGYLITGDYFKGNTDALQGGNPAASVTNDYIILNKLTFTF